MYNHRRGNNLKLAAVSGIKWSAFSQAGRQGMQLLTIIILSRLLTPDDFGLVGMSMVVIGFFGIFKDLGTSAAIIQKKELSEELLPSIFWTNVAFSLLSTVVLFIAAPLGGLLYHEDRVILILRVLSIGFFISGSSILQQAILERSLAFHALAKIEIIAIACGSVAGVGLALWGASVWSLVFQSLITVSVTTILLWMSCPWRPKWIFHWSDVKSVSSFSLNLTGFSIFNYFAGNIDYFLIGRYLGAIELGYYTLAYRIMLFPLQNITQVIARVTFPIYSSIKDDNRRLSAAYLQVAETIALITFPMMMGVIALAHPFVLVVFGEQWHPVILLLMILAPVGMIQSISSNNGSIYRSKGAAAMQFHVGVLFSTIVFIFFLIGLHWGIIGMAASYAIVTLTLIYPSFAIPFRLIELHFAKFIHILYRPLLNSFIMLGVVIGLKSTMLASLPNTAVLLISILLGTIVYVGASLVNNREPIRNIWNLIGLGRED